MQERITDEQVSINTTEADEFEDDVQSLEMDAFEKEEETDQSSEINSTFFF